MSTRLSAAEYRALSSRTKPHKYRAKATVVDGVRFDSKAEAARYAELMIMHRAGLISKPQRQVPFVFELDGEKMFSYIADFVYTNNATGDRIVEDVKGVRTPEYRLKAKIIQKAHNINIVEVLA